MICSITMINRFWLFDGDIKPLPSGLTDESINGINWSGVFNVRVDVIMTNDEMIRTNKVVNDMIRTSQVKIEERI